MTSEEGMTNTCTVPKKTPRFRQRCRVLPTGRTRDVARNMFRGEGGGGVLRFNHSLCTFAHKFLCVHVYTHEKMKVCGGRGGGLNPFNAHLPPSSPFYASGTTDQTTCQVVQHLDTQKGTGGEGPSSGVSPSVALMRSARLSLYRVVTLT